MTELKMTDALRKKWCGIDCKECSIQETCGHNKYKNQRFVFR